MALQVGGPLIHLPGQIIQAREAPFAKVLMQTKKDFRCHWCFREHKELIKCRTCCGIAYCNAECRALDWREAHQFECSAMSFFENNSSPDTDTLRGVLRLYSILQQHPEREIHKAKVYNGTYRAFGNLISHKNRLPTEWDELDKLGFHISGQPPNGHLRQLAGIWLTNSVGIPNGKDVIGSALYIKATIFNHSCRPNAIFHFVGNSQEIEVRAIDTITVTEQVGPLVSYLENEIIGRAHRQHLLKTRYHFDCECPTCQTEKSLKHDSIEYTRIQILIKGLEILQTERPDPGGWEQILQNGSFILDQLRKVFSPSDIRITRNLLLMMNIIAEEEGAADEVLKLARKCKEIIMDSVGKESFSAFELDNILSKAKLTL